MNFIDKFKENLQWDGRKPACIQKILEDVTEKCAGSATDAIKLADCKDSKEFENIIYHHEKLFGKKFICGEVEITPINFKDESGQIKTIIRRGITSKGEVALKKLQSGDTNIW